MFAFLLVFLEIIRKDSSVYNNSFLFFLLLLARLQIPVIVM